MLHFAEHIGGATSFYDVDNKQVVGFLNTKIKSEQIDSDKKWITTWNDYLWRLILQALHSIVQNYHIFWSYTLKNYPIMELSCGKF
jgi:hypothetical protein